MYVDTYRIIICVLYYMYQVRHLGAAFRRNIYHTNPGNTRSKEYHSHNSQEGYSYKRKRRLSRRIFLYKDHHNFDNISIHLCMYSNDNGIELEMSSRQRTFGSPVAVIRC